MRNILIDSRPATSQEEFQQRRRSSPGLTERDVRILEANIEALETLSAAQDAASGARPAEAVARHAGAVSACGRRTASIHSLQLARAGSSTRRTMRERRRFASWARAPRSTCWATAPAVGKFVKVNDTWLEVVGVLTSR